MEISLYLVDVRAALVQSTAHYHYNVLFSTIIGQFHWTFTSVRNEESIDDRVALSPEDKWTTHQKLAPVVTWLSRATELKACDILG